MDKHGESVVQWEYRIEEYNEEYPLEALINDEGQDGWRFVQDIGDGMAVLKRELTNAE